MTYAGWEGFTFPSPERPSKYRAIPTVLDGIRFDSKREATRYRALMIYQRAGLITDLQLQPRFLLHACSPEGELITVCTYVADFAYRRDGVKVVEDVKGVRTAIYTLKRKMVKVEYGIEILET